MVRAPAIRFCSTHQSVVGPDCMLRAVAAPGTIATSSGPNTPPAISCTGASGTRRKAPGVSWTRIRFWCSELIARFSWWWPQSSAPGGITKQGPGPAGQLSPGQVIGECTTKGGLEKPAA
jgi:hypothetical protein